MKVRKLAIALALLGLSSTSLANEKPSTLNQAIDNALKRNEITRSTDELLESIHFSTLALKASKLPRGEFSCSANMNHSQTTTILTYVSTDFSKQCGISAGANIYDGGAHRFELKAAEANEAALRNLFNTADQYTRNTRGGLAFSTLQSFTTLQTTRSEIEINHFFKEAYEVFATAVSDSAQKSILQSRASDFVTQIETLMEKSEVYNDNFEFLVKLPPADQIESLDQTIAGLQIPASVDEAINLAITKGPTVVGKNAEVEMADYSLKALRARSGPSVSVGAHVSRGGYSDQFRIKNDTTYTSASVGITLRIPLDPSRKYRVQAAEHSLSSKKLERTAAIEAAKQDMKATYRILEIDRRNYSALSRDYASQKALVASAIEKIKAGQSSGMDYTSMSANIGILQQRYYSLISKQRNIVDNLYSIRQVTGLLFDEDYNYRIQ